MPEEFENQLKIYFGDELANLFNIDIHQLISYSDLVEQNKIEDANKYFVRGDIINRYSDVLQNNKSKITNVKNGSVELTISGIGISARVSQHFQERGEVIRFDISATDNRLQEIIDNYKKGYFGSEKDGLSSVLNILANAGYNINSNSNNYYNISKVIDKYSKRMIKTINKHR